MKTPRYVVIANPEGLRWRTYEGELHSFWSERGVTPDVEVVPWRDVVPRDGNLDGLTAFDQPALVRLESPGREFAVTKLLLQAGERESDSLKPTDWSTLTFQKGRLVLPGLQYRGFRRVLRGLRSSFDARPLLRPLACPLTIAQLFDKNATCTRLTAAGLPCPHVVSQPATLKTLWKTTFSLGWQSIYLKLNTGSSGSAIMFLSSQDWNRAVGSIRVLDGEIYSTRLLHPPEPEERIALMRFLLDEGACVQQGIRMAQIDGQNFDVRVVVVHGTPAFFVFRLSSLPMTNLHLGGRRGRFDDCRRQIPTRAWLDALDHCAEAAKLYDAAMVGIDLLFERGYTRHFILEINAFGDFFPGLVDSRGWSAHRHEIEASARHFGL